ncbi:DUF1484 family protein [Chromobacterium haemolyticum]|uniref:DUF1484 domain-containing protein n=1 Tax=Chromobacterium haemolyticum TaxID=394935 RepID=A0A1W0C975_9NEIS|nr:DUF1484 family protein [Chromobacterium haemolyticum]OQS31286.1 hypothetical protein B0T45_23080 [Chromobacterium haemolyticum]
MNALILSAVHHQLAQLQQLADTPEHAALREPLSQLVSLCRRIEHTVSAGVSRLTRTGDGLQGLVELLDCAENQPLPAQRLAGLLAPLQQQVIDASADIGQLL